MAITSSIFNNICTIFHQSSPLGITAVLYYFIFTKSVLENRALLAPNYNFSFVICIDLLIY